MSVARLADQNMGAMVRVCPVGMEQPGFNKNIDLRRRCHACAKGASALVIVTEW
jgi:hypothetical protein